MDELMEAVVAEAREAAVEEAKKQAKSSVIATLPNEPNADGTGMYLHTSDTLYCGILSYNVRYREGTTYCCSNIAPRRCPCTSGT